MAPGFGKMIYSLDWTLSFKTIHSQSQVPYLQEWEFQLWIPADSLS